MKPSEAEVTNEILNMFQYEHGFMFKWDKHWIVNAFDWNVNAERPYKLYIELIRNICHFWHNERRYDNLGEIQVFASYWLYYDSAIDGFNNGVLNIVQQTSGHHTFVYIQVR